MSCRLLIDYCCVLVRAGFLTNVDVVIIFCDLRLFNNFFCFCKCHRKFRNVEICQKISLVLVLLLEECVPEKWCRKISQHVLQIFHYSYFDGKFRWFFLQLSYKQFLIYIVYLQFLDYLAGHFTFHMNSMN